MNVTRWIIGLWLLPLLCWIAACWYVSEQFLSIGLVEYDESEEAQILQGFNLTGLKKEAVEVSNGEVTLSGSFFRHPNHKDCAVVLLPGIGGYRTQVLPILPVFWALNCHVLAYDPRGTGGSSKVPRTFGYYEKEDNAAVIRWLAQHTELETSSIGIWGPSFGAAVGILTLDEIDQLGFVIADSTFHSFKRVTHDTIALLASPPVATLLSPGVLSILELRTGMNVDQVNPASSIRGTATPVLLIHALHDPAMHISHSQIVFESRTTANVNFEITDYYSERSEEERSGHADSALIDPEAYEALIVAFLHAEGVIEL